MSKKLLSIPTLFLLLTLSAFCLFQEAFANPSLRVIKTCVLMDKLNLPDKKAVDAVLKKAFREYEIMVGVRFEIVKAGYFSGDMSELKIKDDKGKLQIDFKYFSSVIENDCGPDAEVKIIYSTYKMIFIDYTNDPSGESVMITGLTEQCGGIVIIFDVNERYRMKDKGGHPAVESTTKHELGHLFNLGHLNDTNSFMYSPSLFSYGRWTEEVIRHIKANKYFKCD